MGTSFSGGTVPTDGVVAASDPLLIHGNGVEPPARIAETVREARSRPAYDGQSVVFDEDDRSGFADPPSDASVALAEHASWGYFDPGTIGYLEGSQSPPVGWSIDTPRKRAPFERVAAVIGSDPGDHGVDAADVDPAGARP